MLAHRHVMTCLSNEALAERIGLDPVFNITYVDKLVAEIGAGICEKRCMLSSLQMTKDQKTKLSDWDLLYSRAVSESNRRAFDLVGMTPNLLKGLD